MDSDTLTKDEWGRQVVPCVLCEQPTAMLGTRRCDRCWELETRINHDPELARKVLRNMERDHDDNQRGDNNGLLPL